MAERLASLIALNLKIPFTDQKKRVTRGKAWVTLFLSARRYLGSIFMRAGRKGRLFGFLRDVPCVALPALFK